MFDYRACLSHFRFIREPWMGDVLASCTGRRGIGEILDYDPLAHFDCSDVVLISGDNDCDGPSDYFRHYPGTVYWMDSARLEREAGSDWFASPFDDDFRAIRWTDFRPDEDYRYASQFHPQPWAEDDSIGIPALDHRYDD